MQCVYKPEAQQFLGLAPIAHTQPSQLELSVKFSLQVWSMMVVQRRIQKQESLAALDVRTLLALTQQLSTCAAVVRSLERGQCPEPVGSGD